MPSCTNCGAYAGEERWRTLCRKCFTAQKRRQDEEKDDLLAELRAQLQMLRISSNSIPADRLKQLIFLCHPDKHNNSETANEVTQWLLSQRKRK